MDGTSRHDEETGFRHKGPSSSLAPGGVAEPIFLILIIILILSTIILFAIGIWLLASHNGWPVGLDNTGSIGWTRTISYGTACIVVAILLIPIIIFSIFGAGAKRGAPARVTRLVAVFLAAVAFICLVLMAITGIMFAANGPQFIEDIIDDAWVNTVTGDDTFPDACVIQDRFNCRGWEPNSCINCRPTIGGTFTNCTDTQREVCPRCFSDAATTRSVVGLPSGLHQTEEVVDGGESVRQQTGVRGCKEFVERRYREFFIPMTIYVIFLALITLLLAWKTCIDSRGFAH